MRIELPEQDSLLAMFRYDVETGALYWRDRNDMRPQWNAHYAGKEAGNRSHPGRVSIMMKGYGFIRAHRIIWKMVYGTEPHLIDHKDGNGYNNLLDNLRVATKAQNSQNMKMRNKTGFKGVSFHRTSGLWHAKIQVDGKQKSLGYHKAPELAHQAYVKAAERHFGEFARAA